MKKSFFLNSSKLTVGVVLASTVLIYVLLYFLVLNLFSCNQKGTGELSFDRLFGCIILIVRFTLLYLLSIIGLLIIFIRKKVLNNKGVIFCIILFTLILFYILCTEKNIF